MPSGARIAVTVQLSSRPSPNRSRPIARTPSFTARLSLRCRASAASTPSWKYSSSAACSPCITLIAGVHGFSGYGSDGERPVLAPVEVEASASVACSAALRARSLIATNAMPGLADSAFCDPPTATSIPQASNAKGTAPRLETTSTTTSTPASRATARELLDRLDHAGRGLGLRQQHGLRSGVRGQRVRELGGIEPGPPLVLGECAPSARRRLRGAATAGRRTPRAARAPRPRARRGSGPRTRARRCRWRSAGRSRPTPSGRGSRSRSVTSVISFPNPGPR